MGNSEQAPTQLNQGFPYYGKQVKQAMPMARNNLPPIEYWPAVDELALPPERRHMFILRRTAMQMYLAGAKHYEISDATGISRDIFYRLLRRVKAIHPDGRIWGLRALIPWTRSSPLGVSRYRKSPGDPTWSGPGAFKALLDRHPSLDKLIRSRLLKSRLGGKVHESRIPIIKLHGELLRACRELGLNPLTDYPFTGKHTGYASLVTYANKILSESTSRAVAIRYGDDAAKKLRVGSGTLRPINFPYERVECDAHHIDALFCILLTNTNGDVFPLVVPRLWLLVIKDVISRVILGYYLSLNKECNQDDLLKCIQNALRPWKPRNLSGTRLRYAPGAGFPSSIGEQFVAVGWDEFSVDGAKINMSERVEIKLQTLVDSKVILLPRRVPDDRPYVERFFGILEEEGFHRLPNTTGSSPSDIRRKSPEVAACKYFIQLEDLENLLDVLIANFNGTVHGSLAGRTPLEYLDWSHRHCQDFRPLKHIAPEAVNRIRAIHAGVRVRGGKGRRPFVSFKNATYSCAAFSHAHELVGKRLTIEADPDDARVVFAYFPDGQELGPLTAAPPWDREPHTFQMRSLIVARIRERKWQRDDFSDPVQSLLLDLEERTRSTGKISSDYLQVRQYILERRQEFLSIAEEGPREFAETITLSVLKAKNAGTVVTTEIMPTPRMAKQRER